MNNPIQPLEQDEHGALRFKANKIVRHLIDNGSLNMNYLSSIEFSDEDRQQFAQLIGYSLSGYGELSYVDDYSYNCAELMYECNMTEDKARISFLELQLKALKDALRVPIASLFEINPDDLGDK